MGKIETAIRKGETYKLPKVRNDHAGIVVSLAKFQHVDDSSFQEEEIVWRLRKEYHIGLILKAKNEKEF